MNNKKGFVLSTVLLVSLVSLIAGAVVTYGLEKSNIINLSPNDSPNNIPIERFQNNNNNSTGDLNKTSSCGDGICAGDLYEMGGPNGACPQDCACGNGKCNPGENPQNCKEDCCGYCGDGKCIGYACQEDNKSSKSYCPKQNGGDCGNVCGDGICQKGENTCICAEDCKWQKCGDGECTPDDGGPESCPSDCASKCGDCICSGGEDYIKCPNDCGYCGDLVCSNCTQLNENTRTCAKDCQ